MTTIVNLNTQCLKNSKINVLYLSKNFIVIDKQYDLKINSDDQNEITLASLLAKQYSHLLESKLPHGFRFIQRLDYATSGCICLALNKLAAKLASKAFERRTTSKCYIALVRGHINLESSIFHINWSIGKDSNFKDINRMCIGDLPQCLHAKEAKTTVVLLNLGTYEGQPASKVLLIPSTGRTHQLRVHLSQLGFPIVGDYSYSQPLDTTPYRMMLHSLFIKIPLNCLKEIHQNVNLNSSISFYDIINTEYKCDIETLKDLLMINYNENLNLSNLNNNSSIKKFPKVKKNTLTNIANKLNCLDNKMESNYINLSSKLIYSNLLSSEIYKINEIAKLKFLALNKILSLNSKLTKMDSTILHNCLIEDYVVAYSEDMFISEKDPLWIPEKNIFPNFYKSFIEMILLNSKSITLNP